MPSTTPHLKSEPVQLFQDVWSPVCVAGACGVHSRRLPFELEIGSVDVHLLAIQARVLLWVGLAWLTFGLWSGFDPATVAWRAALGAFVAMFITGKLLRVVTGVINDRMTTDMAERQLAAEQAAAAAAAAPVPVRAGAPAAPRRR